MMRIESPSSTVHIFTDEPVSHDVKSASKNLDSGEPYTAITFEVLNSHGVAVVSHTVFVWEASE